MSTTSRSDKITFTKTRYLFLWLLLFYVVYSFIYGFLGAIVTELPDYQDPLVTHILYSCSFISLCCYLVIKLKRSQLNPNYLIGNLRPNYSWLPLLGIAIIFLLFSLGAALLSFKAIASLFPDWYESFLESVSEQEARVSVFPTINRVWQTINYVAVAPITEEFIFRGVLLHRLATKWNLPIAIWSSSIIFGCLHPNPVGISVVGIAWALLYLKTRTLIVPIVAHSMNNSLVVLGELLGELTDNQDAALDSLSNSNGQEWIAGSILVVVLFPFIWRFIYRRFPRRDLPLPYFANQSQQLVK